MRIIYTLVISLAVVLDYIELSSNFECLPNGDDIAGVPRCGPSLSSDRPASPAESPLRARSRSPLDEVLLRPKCKRLRVKSNHPAKDIAPLTRLPSSDGFGYKLEELEFIRLIPNSNPHRQFELRRYTFPANNPLKLSGGYNKFLPIPNQELIVLSTFDGDVFAILETSYILAGLYVNKTKRRSKINMESGTVTTLMGYEVGEVPVGIHHPLRWYFKIHILNHNTPDHQLNENKDKAEI